ncbi:LysR substrate-binding domain-containing protein [Pantoea agglomerans]|uniref:LysR substrate-binding domain-containing protein n=1 Tax=Enterobacter agglomerans TaxID=549 RepID=UPI003C7AD641
MKRRLPSLNALRAFEAAGRLGRLNLAADELAVTHGAVSRQVKQLETWLGTRLFTGTRHAPQLSTAGARLLPELSTAFDRIEMAVCEIAKDREGPLDVSCPGTFTMKWLIPRLHHFNVQHPDIEVRLSSHAKSSDPLTESADVAIRITHGSWPDNMEVLPLFNERFGPVCTPSLAAGRRYPPSVPLLHTISRRTAWADWQKLSGESLAGTGESEYEHFYFMLEAAIAGLGMAIAPWPLVADDVMTGRLIAPYGFINSGLDYVVLRRKGQNHRADIFCSWLQCAAADYAISEGLTANQIAAADKP